MCHEISPEQQKDWEELLKDSSFDWDSVLEVRPLTSNATIPTRHTAGSAGLDLYAAHNYLILPFSQGIVLTDIAIKLPIDTYGRIAPKSGLAINHFISIGAGVVDEDYRGNVGVIIFNHSREPFDVEKGAQIAQLIVEKIQKPKVVVCPFIAPTRREINGFGNRNLTCNRQ